MFYTKDEIISMDQGGQIYGEILDDAFDALNGFCDLVGREFMEECICHQRYDNTTAHYFYTGLYGGGLLISGQKWKQSIGILAIIDRWKDWQLVKNLPNTHRLKEKLVKIPCFEGTVKDGDTSYTIRKNKGENFPPFSFDNVDFELHAMANIIRAGGSIEIIRESPDGKVPDFRFRFNTEGDWIYGEITRRGNGTWDYAKGRANKLVSVISKNVAGGEATLAIKRTILDEEFERLLGWLESNPCDMCEFEDIALFYTNSHGVDNMNLSLKFINVPFFGMSGGSFEKNNFMRIHAPYEDGLVSKVSDENGGQLELGKKNILFIDSTNTTYIASRKIIDIELQKEENTYISAIILIRMGLDIKTEVLIIKNHKAVNPVNEDELDKISSVYKRL